LIVKGGDFVEKERIRGIDTEAVPNLPIFQASNKIGDELLR
jgi:hypothetical protein